MRTSLQQILFEGMTISGTDDNRSCTCGWLSRHSFGYVQLLDKNGLGPAQMLGSALFQIVDKLETMNDPIIRPEGWVPCAYRWHADLNYRAVRRHKMSDFNKASGLCLDCVRSDTNTEGHLCKTHR